MVTYRVYGTNRLTLYIILYKARRTPSSRCQSKCMDGRHLALPTVSGAELEPNCAKPPQFSYVRRMNNKTAAWLLYAYGFFYL